MLNRIVVLAAMALSATGICSFIAVSSQSFEMVVFDTQNYLG